MLKYLMLNKETTNKVIMVKFNLTESEVLRHIDAINNYSEKDLIFSDQEIIYMTENSKVVGYESFIKGKERLFTYHDADDRYNLILLKLIVDVEFLSLQCLANFCLVSKNTILNDLKVIKDDLAKCSLNLSYSRRNGYSIAGSEFIIRNLLVSTVKNTLNSLAGRILLDEKEIITESEIFLLRKRLERVESRIGIKLTDEQLDELPYVLLVIIRRAHNLTDKWSFKVEKYDIKNTIEYPEIKNMFWKYDFLSETDLLYLSLQVLASNTVESALQVSDGEEISIATDSFINNIEGFLAINITRRDELKEKLIMHMRPAIYRNLLGFQINNPLTNEFISEYQAIYNIVIKSVSPYEKIIQHKLSKEEMVYLSMIVLSYVYQTEEESETIIKAAVLCKSGTSISKLLLETLRSMFSNIEFIGAYSVRQFDQIEENVDFIFTTIPINKDITTFLIPSILDKQTRVELKRRVNKEADNNKKMIKKLIFSIMDYVPKENIPAVSKKVNTFFNNDLQKSEEGLKSKGEFTFSIDNFSIVEEQVIWSQLVDFSMKPLLKRKSITEEYVYETSKAFYQSYEQMIIAPNIYLPHVRPEYGVNNMDFQILVFKNPILSPLNKKVKVVVALAPSKENTHVATLIKLNNLLLDPEILSNLSMGEKIFEIKKMLNERE